MNLDDLFLRGRGTDAADASQNDGDQFIRQIMSSLAAATKASNDIPAGDDFDYHATMFPQFAALSEECATNAAKLILEVCKYVNPDHEQVDLPSDLLDPSFYAHVVDVIDSLLETVDIRLDQATGKDSQFTSADSSTMDKDLKMHAHYAIDMPKPQLAFIGDIDNSRERPFRPRIVSKTHALVPLDLTESRNTDATSDAVDVVAPSTFFAHPYETELMKLRYHEWQLEDPLRLSSSPSPSSSCSFADAKVPSPDDRPFQFVDTDDDFELMLGELQGSGAREIALDLENHSYRSFQGFACLMQISTRVKDYVVDALVLRSQMHRLGIIFSDPDIVKILHGSENDNLWLQRDFGLYLVNVFDTYHAAKALKFPALSLAHLLASYAHVRLNKKHQLSDWRQRPLPADMIAYARSDTVYMHYLHDRMRRDLWKAHGKEGVESVLNASKKWCMRRYEKDFFCPLGYRRLLNPEGGAGRNSNSNSSSSSSSSSKSNRSEQSLTQDQDVVVAALWSWRDLTAREEDESPAFVMSNAELIRIGQRLPRTLQQLEDCGPLSFAVRQRASTVLEIISTKLHAGPTPVALAAAPSSSSSIPTETNDAVLRGNRKRKIGEVESTNGETSAEGSQATVHTFVPVVGGPQVLRGGGSSVDSDEMFRLAGWGLRAATVKVTVSIAGQSKSTAAGKKGRAVAPLEAKVGTVGGKVTRENMDKVKRTLASIGSRSRASVAALTNDASTWLRDAPDVSVAGSQKQQQTSTSRGDSDTDVEAAPSAALAASAASEVGGEDEDEVDGRDQEDRDGDDGSQQGADAVLAAYEFSNQSQSQGRKKTSGDKKRQRSGGPGNQEYAESTSTTFDYSRVAQGLSMGALGNATNDTANAPPSGSSAIAKGRDGKNNSRGGNAMRQQQAGPKAGGFNPYLEKTPRQPKGAAGTAHFNPDIQRRPNDRTFVYSQNSGGSGGGKR